MKRVPTASKNAPQLTVTTAVNLITFTIYVKGNENSNSDNSGHIFDMIYILYFSPCMTNIKLLNNKQSSLVYVVNRGDNILAVLESILFTSTEND